jgi:leader peptidase (prepilin peptidase)/N-methyltransferase
MYYMQAVLVAVIGLTFGSFINAYVWRIHKQSKSKNKSYSILSGRSMCPKCGSKLKPLDLVPIISWLMLRGKCRYCYKTISAEYPIVEIVTTALFVLSYVYWPLGFKAEGIFYFVFWLFLIVNLVALAIYDIHWLTLPNRIMYLLYSTVIVQVLVTFGAFHGGLHYLIGDLLGIAIGGGMFYILFQVSNGKWIGGGDVKLGAILGLYIGSGVDAILLIFIASVLGSLYSISLMTLGKLDRKSLIPYGPFLIVGVIVLRLFGQSLTSWLKTKGLIA